MKRIPVPIGILVILLCIGVIGVSLELVTRTKTRASKAIQPQSVLVANISDSSLAILWKTEDPATGIVYLTGPDGSTQVGYDSRDIRGISPHRSHFVTFSSLLPKTKYDALIVSDGAKFPLESGPIITAPVISDSYTDLQPAFGTVLPGSTDPGDDIVVLTPDGGQTFAAQIKPSGSWVIPLSSARTASLQARFSTALSKKITITTLLSPQTTILTTTDTASPVPNFSLGETNDFTVTQPLQPTPEQSKQQTNATQVLGVSDEISVENPKPGELTILQPKQNSTIALPRPIIRGSARPTTRVIITLSGEKPEVGVVQSDAHGIFLYTPKRNLSAGKHTVTVTSAGNNGKPTAMTHVFFIR